MFCLVCTYLLPPVSFALLFLQTHIFQVNSVQSLVAVQFNVRPMTISHLFLFLLLIYFQLHRHLPYLVLLVWSIPPFLLQSWLLTSAWTAILVCLEHSFWSTLQGSNPSDGFVRAWKIYLKTQCALVNQRLNDYLRSKGSNDWFTTQHYPSEAECDDYRTIILNSLLCKSSLFFFKLRELLIYLQLILKPLGVILVTWLHRYTMPIM